MAAAGPPASWGQWLRIAGVQQGEVGQEEVHGFVQVGIHVDQQHPAHVSQEAHHIEEQEDQGEGVSQVPEICDAQEDEFRAPLVQLKFSGLIQLNIN